MKNSIPVAKLNDKIPEIAEGLGEYLNEVTGKEVGWVLLCHVDDTSVYLSNLEREGSVAIMQSLLDRWKSNPPANILITGTVQ